MVDNGVMTRSLYIGGRNKAAEVAKRREQFEKEMETKRLAKLREQEEKIARIAKQKESELREKARQKAEKDLKKQKEVLDRRMTKLESEKSKKEEILFKAHSVASRTMEQKKPIYAFGSRTPRELSYLEKLSKDQKEYNKRLVPTSGFANDIHNAHSKHNATADSTPISRNTSTINSNSSMTSSMYSPFTKFNDNASKTSPSKILSKRAQLPSTTTLSPNKRFGETNKQNNSLKPHSLMTQSLYIPVKSRNDKEKQSSTPKKLNVVPPEKSKDNVAKNSSNTFNKINANK